MPTQEQVIICTLKMRSPISRGLRCLAEQYYGYVRPSILQHVLCSSPELLHENVELGVTPIGPGICIVSVTILLHFLLAAQ